jgi:hypothetical protein
MIFRTATALANLGDYLLKQKKYKEAELALREGVGIAEKKRPDDWTTFSMKSLLGGSLLGQKRYAEAEPLLVQGYEGIKQRQDKIRAPSKKYLTEALQRVVQLYEDRGKPGEAAKWRQELEATRKATIKPGPANGAKRRPD